MNQLTLFDFRELDAETRIVVQQEDKEFDRNMGEANTSFVHACKNLQRIHEALRYKRPGFEEYCQSKGLPTPTAYKMLNVAEMSINFIDISSGQFGKSALYLLAAPGTPDEARAEAIERAEAGETITHAKAKDIVAEYKPAPALHLKAAILARTSQIGNNMIQIGNDLNEVRALLGNDEQFEAWLSSETDLTTTAANLAMAATTGQKTVDGRTVGEWLEALAKE